MKWVGLEACSLTAWLHRRLSEAGMSAICIDARQAKAAMGAGGGKRKPSRPAALSFLALSFSPLALCSLSSAGAVIWQGERW